MVKPGTLKTLEDVSAWIYEHDGRIEAWWEAQREHNARATSMSTTCQLHMQKRMSLIDEKLDRVARKVYIAIGATWLGGAIVGVGATVAAAYIGRG